VGNGLIEIEPLSIGPDKSALLGVEVHVLHEIAERVGQLGKLLAFGRMPPLEEIIKQGIVREDTVSQIVHIRFAPTAHEVALLRGLNCEDAKHSLSIDGMPALLAWPRERSTPEARRVTPEA
jgi:hypothetical protein